jgi:hypothetical protein
VQQDSPPASPPFAKATEGTLEARKHGDENGEELLLWVASKERVLNEFLIGQGLSPDRSGSQQGSGPMRNSFNVFSGGRKRSYDRK